MKKLLFLTTVLLFVSCATTISTKLANKNYQKLNEETEIIVLDKGEELPSDSDFIGDVKIGDSGFTTDCGYNKVVGDVINSARNSGANIVKLIEVKQPTAMGSTCYRINAKIYRNLNAQSLASISEKRRIKNKSRLPEDADHALIHFYRPTSGVGSLLYYAIKNDNDSVIGKIKNGEKFICKTKKFGTQSFYGAIETKQEVIINVEKGKEYFVRCGVSMGVVVGRPVINLVENYIGIQEFDAIIPKKPTQTARRNK